jgi:hypothetical protein
MSTTNQKPPGKPGQRSRKPKQPGKKPDQRQRAKPDQQPDRQQDDQDLIEAVVASTETFPIEAEASTAASSIDAAVAEPPSKGALVPIHAAPVAAIASLDTFLTGFQTIANAYRACALRSLDDTMFFVEKLTVVRSLDKAVEIQTEFAKQACESLLTDSQKIWRLYRELAKQVLKPFERLVMRVTQTAG